MNSITHLSTYAAQKMKSSSTEIIPILLRCSSVWHLSNNIYRSEPFRKYAKCNYQLHNPKEHHRCQALGWASKPNSLGIFFNPYNVTVSGPCQIEFTFCLESKSQ